MFSVLELITLNNAILSDEVVKFTMYIHNPNKISGFLCRSSIMFLFRKKIICQLKVAWIHTFDKSPEEGLIHGVCGLHQTLDLRRHSSWKHMALALDGCHDSFLLSFLLAVFLRHCLWKWQAVMKT